MAAATSWIVAQSEQALKQNINAYSKHALIDNVSSRDILPRRLKFVRPTKEANARPETASSSSSSSSPPRPGRQRSDFNAASIQLFDESNIIPLMQWKQAVNDHGAGLRNLGNSCFMNATLQCLCYTAPFQNYIATKHHTKRCKTSGYCIFCELVKLMPTMLYSQHTAVPKSIFTNLRMLSKKLRPGRQEDAQEFLRFLMEGLQNSCLKQEGRKIKDMRIQETTFIHKLWGGYLRSQIKCCKCGYESNTYDSILDISLEIKGTSVHSAFKHFTDAEILDDDNKYQCDNCKKKRRAVKQFTIFEPPNVLVIHLKRFECGGGGLFSGGKINKFVKFEDDLDLSEFMSYQTCPKVSYSLFGVLVHYGYSSHGGHYVSYIKAPDQRWYLMDDSSVRPVNIQTVLKEKAYLLFYQRNEPKVLYQSPTASPKLKQQSSITPKIRNNTSLSSLDTLQELADHLPNNADLLYKKVKHSPNKESSQLSGSKRLLSTRHDTSHILPSKKSRSSSEDTTPTLAPLRNRISIKESTTKNLIRNSKSLLSNDSSEEMDLPRTRKYNLRRLKSSQTKDTSLEWQKDGTDGNGNEEKSMSSPSSISGEKRKHSSDDEDVIGEVSNIIPTKKRKTITGTSMPIKVDKEFRQKHLRLLKNRKSRNRRSSLNSLPSISSTHSQSSTKSGSASSSPSYNTSWSYGSGRAANNLRRTNANKFVGRRSNTLKLAAKSSLHASPRRIWNRKAERRASQMSAEEIHRLHKFKTGSLPVQAALSDSSSESVLSDLNNLPHKSTPSMVSDDSSGSISPQTYSPNPNPNINTTLPSHDGSSPHTLLPMPSSSSALGLDGKLPKLFNANINTNTSSSSTSIKPERRCIVAPVHSLKNMAKHSILSKNSIPDRPRPHKATLITDHSVIDQYLRDEASVSSAIGIGNVAAWSENTDNGQETRKLIIKRAKQPIVPEKDEWDLALDSGLAYPHKPKSARDPFKHFDRENHVNRFQSKQQAQISGLDKIKKSKKKKGNYHNKNRFHNRKRRNSIHA